jgi:hypothetical protein
MRSRAHRRGRSKVTKVGGGEPVVPARASYRGARLVGQRAVQCRRLAQGGGSGAIWGWRGPIEVEVPTTAWWRSLTAGVKTRGGWCRHARRGAV